MKITIQVEKQPGEKSYSCFMLEDNNDFNLAGYGTTAREAIEDMYVARDEIKELMESEGKSFPKINFEFRFDVGALFNYYSFLNIEGVAKKAGINPSLMRQYASAIHRPSAKRNVLIQNCVHDIAKEIQSVVVSNG